MLLGLRTKIALAVAVSAVAGLIVAASFLKRRKRPPRGKTINLSRNSSSLSCRSSNGPMQVSYRRQLFSPQHGGSPRALSRLSRSNRSLASKKSGYSNAEDSSLSGSVNSLAASESSYRSGERTPTNEPVTVQRLFRLGVEAFESAIAFWEQAVDDLQHGTEEDTLDESENMPPDMDKRLQRILKDAYNLQAEYEETVFSLPVSGISTSDLNELSSELASYKGRLSDSDNDSTTDSFVSATELAELEEMSSGLESPTLSRKHDLYDRALDAAQDGVILCRRKRTKMLRCRSDEDFLAKVHCVRQAMAILLQDAATLEWFMSMGRGVIGDVLCKASYDAEEFGNTFDDLMEYCRDPESWKAIDSELRGRGVQFMSFYDIVLDFLLLDAFDDLESPPTSVTCITQNRWLSNRVKETALSTAVWSVLGAKRRMLQNPNGFLAKVYNISYHVTPALAWGFLGSDPDLLDLMNFFKDQVLGFARDMFSLRKCRYTTVPELADDILTLANQYNDTVSERLST